jgi:hypothetical protein
MRMCMWCASLLRLTRRCGYVGRVLGRIQTRWQVGLSNWVVLVVVEMSAAWSRCGEVGASSVRSLTAGHDMLYHVSASLHFDYMQHALRSSPTTHRPSSRVSSSKHVPVKSWRVALLHTTTLHTTLRHATVLSEISVTPEILRTHIS